MTVRRNIIVKTLRQIVACDIFSQLKFPRKTSRHIDMIEAFIYFEQ